MKNQRASRIGIGIGLKSNILVAQQAIDLSKFLSQMPFSSTESSIVERPKTNSRIFAHTRWDAIPVAAALFHCVYFFGMFYLLRTSRFGSCSFSVLFIQ